MKDRQMTYKKGEKVVYDDRRLAKVVEAETGNGNVRVAYYDAYSGEQVRMWVSTLAIRRVK